jgi:RimJ/RimL family protein N-acetyltransferase
MFFDSSHTSKSKIFDKSSHDTELTELFMLAQKKLNTWKSENKIPQVKLVRNLWLRPLEAILTDISPQTEVQFHLFTQEFDALLEDDIAQSLHIPKIKTFRSYLQLFHLFVEKDPCWLLCEEEKFVGIFYLYDNHPEYHRANMSVGIIQQYRGAHLSEAVAKAMCVYLSQNGYTRLGLEISQGNIASLHLTQQNLTKLGFAKEGILRNYGGKGMHYESWSYTVD